METARVSIIIPVLNEENYLPDTIHNLKALNPAAYEIIAVDGGSTDRTCSILHDFGIVTYYSEKSSRAIQMNVGSRNARGDILVFLHADTRIPLSLITLVSRYMTDDKLSLGGFISVMTGTKNRPIVTGLNYIKTWLWTFFINPKRFLFDGLKIIFGDQVMFCRKNDFDRIGGFREDYQILEDADLCLRINHLGKIKQFPEKVYTSDRRVKKQGFFKAMLVYVFIATLWTVGYPTDKLAKYYKNIR